MYVCDDQEPIIIACMVSQYELNTKIMGCFGMPRPRMNANLWDLVFTHLVNEAPVARNRLLPNVMEVCQLYTTAAHVVYRVTSVRNLNRKFNMGRPQRPLVNFCVFTSKARSDERLNWTKLEYM